MRKLDEIRGAASVERWLRVNCVKCENLTEHDRACLRAATEVAAVWLRGDFDKRDFSAKAFGFLVAQMTPATWGIAFHCVAHVGDWGHRAELWKQALLPEIRIPACAFEPGGFGWLKWKEEFQRRHPEAAEAERQRNQSKTPESSAPGGAEGDSTGQIRGLSEPEKGPEA
jgi:hypothetical protein